MIHYRSIFINRTKLLSTQRRTYTRVHPIDESKSVIGTFHPVFFCWRKRRRTFREVKWRGSQIQKWHMVQCYCTIISNFYTHSEPFSAIMTFTRQDLSGLFTIAKYYIKLCLCLSTSMRSFVMHTRFKKKITIKISWLLDWPYTVKNMTNDNFTWSQNKKQ